MEQEAILWEPLFIHYLRMGRFGNLGEREVAKDQNICLYGSYVVNDQIA